MNTTTNIRLADLSWRPGSRRGAMVALMAVLIPTLMVVGAMAINIAYMQLTRTELMVATDAAARAGGRAMSFYQDVDEAKMAAQATAALNSIAGEALRLSIDDDHNVIEFGDCDENDLNSRFAFTKIATSTIRSGTQSANAVRVNATLNDQPLLFPTFRNTSDFDVDSQAVAMQVDRDVSLILDRSGSMAWGDYDWPSGTSPWSYTALEAGVAEGILYKRHGRYYYSSGQDSYTYQDWAWEELYELGPAPTPWNALNEAVSVFLGVLEATDQTEQVALATYSSGASLDMQLSSDYASILAELNTLGPSGSTAIGRGMETGMPALLSAQARPFASKTIIVMTDGLHNTGIDPVSVATTIVATYDVTIHTVTFGSGADINRMQQVAAIGSGRHYHASDSDELVEVFEEIANNLPTIVTQ